MKWLPSICLGLLLAGCATAPGTKVLTSKDSGRTVTVPVGAMVEVELAANPTTGYDWEPVSGAGPALKLVRSSYTRNPAPQDYAGVGGTETFRFHAEKAGQEVVQLNYVRPWEKNAPPAETVRFTVAVQ